jgi:hypothetical protein
MRGQLLRACLTVTVSWSLLSRRQVARPRTDGGISSLVHNARPTPSRTSDSETGSSSSGQDAYENEKLSQEQRLAQMLSGPTANQSLRRQVQGLSSPSAPLFTSLKCPAVSRHASNYTNPPRCVAPAHHLPMTPLIAFRASGSKKPLVCFEVCSLPQGRPTSLTTANTPLRSSSADDRCVRLTSVSLRGKCANASATCHSLPTSGKHRTPSSTTSPTQSQKTSAATSSVEYLSEVGARKTPPASVTISQQSSI